MIGYIGLHNVINRTHKAIESSDCPYCDVIGYIGLHNVIHRTHKANESSDCPYCDVMGYMAYTEHMKPLKAQTVHIVM